MTKEEKLVQKARTFVLKMEEIIENTNNEQIESLRKKFLPAIVLRGGKNHR